MNEPNPVGMGAGAAGQDEAHSALFAELVMQQANMALMLLGKTVHPGTGQLVRDLEAAKLFIDQLDMLQAKTKGNLTRQEAGLLQQSLTTLRLSFVEAVDSPAQPPAPETPPQTSSGSTAGQPGGVGDQSSLQAGGEDHAKKFTKKY